MPHTGYRFSLVRMDQLEPTPFCIFNLLHQIHFTQFLSKSRSSAKRVLATPVLRMKKRLKEPTPVRTPVTRRRVHSKPGQQTRLLPDAEASCAD